MLVRHALALALTAVGAVAQATAWPEVPTPPRTRTEWVGEDAVVNGLPARIERFESELTPAEVLQFYKRQWSGKLGEPRSVVAPGWQVLSALSGAFQLVLQVRPKPPSGSEGVISVADFQGFKRLDMPAFLPRFGDTELTQMTQSSDGPRASQLATLVSRASFDICVHRWRDHWLRQGWSPVFERRGSGDQGAPNWVASFDKPPQSIDLVLTRDGVGQRVYITANLLSPQP